jgi:hypothetical protein
MVFCYIGNKATRNHLLLLGVKTAYIQCQRYEYVNIYLGTSIHYHGMVLGCR